MTNLTAIPVPNESYCVRRLGEETVFLAESGDAIHALDGMGTFIWEAVDGVRSLEDILERICAEYEVEREVAAADLVLFMDELAGKEIVGLKD